MTYPHVPAAFINAIAEEGTKADAIEFLQREWNEARALRAALEDIADGKGRFSTDPFQHAKNTIEDMKALAKAALAGECNR